MTANDPTRGESVNSVPLDIEATLEAIDNRRRRLVIEAVASSDEPTNAGRLADSLAVIETETDHIDAATRKSVYVGLTQSHLDKLDELGVVDYDDQRKTVQATDATRPLADLIRHVESVCLDNA